MPAFQSEHAVGVVENGAGDDGSKGVGDGLGDEQGRNHPAAVNRGVPIREIQNHAGKKSGLRSTEQKAIDEEAGRSGGKRGERRHQTPGDHDACNPNPRADPFQDQIARNFEQEVTEEENAGAEPVNVRGQAEILVHRQRRKRDVGAVDVGDAVEHNDQRQQPPRYFCDGSRFDRAHVATGHDRPSRTFIACYSMYFSRRRRAPTRAPPPRRARGIAASVGSRQGHRSPRTAGYCEQKGVEGLSAGCAGDRYDQSGRGARLAFGRSRTAPSGAHRMGSREDLDLIGDGGRPCRLGGGVKGATDHLIEVRLAVGLREQKNLGIEVCPHA